MIGKTAIVGNGDGIMVFKAAGVTTFPAEDEKRAREILRKIAKEYQVIFLVLSLFLGLSNLFFVHIKDCLNYRL